ncbi:MAG: peptidase caspase catalytic subunit p20 [Labilithrix sp.]|nr:peptidase caspase catalytic subunit p20 [Labilithrix sp.]
MTSLPRFLPAFFVLLAALGLSAPARADDKPYAYGILVGTNAGGAGQQTLRYAEDDARKMADVLRQLGHYGHSDLRVMVRPDAAHLLAAIDEVGGRMRAHQARGEQAVLVFYYSGHARAGSFSLGGEELAVTTLRERLRQIPSTLTLVVLDACQSGQFARIKGAEPAADFSYNSVSKLTTRGIAVMASSTAQELSQESDELKSSYFTHHLIVGLRGAADGDGDGRVSLDEAYRYAYRRTLAATSETQVGGQHVTLETDLAGQGEVPVTYPSETRSQLELPGELEARVLVQQKQSGSVVAEVQKASGAPLRLAFTAGVYEAIVRDAAPPGKVHRCKLTLTDERVVALDLGACENVRITSRGVVKGENEPDDPEPDVAERPSGGRPVDGWNLEAGFGFIGRTDDSYTRNLNTFGYTKDRGLVEVAPIRASLAVSKGFLPHLSVGLQAATLAQDEYRRNVGQSDDSFTFSGYGVNVFVRVATDVLGSTADGQWHLDVYGQVGGGMALARSELVTSSSAKDANDETTKDTQTGLLANGAAGLAVTRLPVTVFAQASYDYAPALANLVGDTHNVGGPAGQLGLRFQVGK